MIDLLEAGQHVAETNALTRNGKSPGPVRLRAEAPWIAIMQDQIGKNSVMRCAGLMKFRVLVVWYRKAIGNLITRRFAFTVALVLTLFPYGTISANAATFDLLPGKTVELEITGDLSTPGSITITESMQPTIVELLSTPSITSFSGFIHYTEVSQSGSVNTGFFIPQACAAPGDCGPLGGVFECICGIDFPEGTIAARDGYPITISVTDASRYFQFVDYFSTVGLVTSVGILPFDLRLTVDASDGLGINFISGTTPLPATLPLFASALGALGVLGWRRKRKAAAALKT